MRECTADEVEQHGDESAKEGESGRPAVSSYQHILKAAEDGDIKAVLLLDQIKTFRKEKPYWFESTIRFNYGTLIPTTEN